uniref:Aspartate kinase n=1 Tax=candidate division WOR-3 bacterium TaxID=2052148 RepID=A0A7C4U7W7_UNCW3
MKVVKFGGTSLGNSERFNLAIDSVSSLVKKNEKVIVVVSAMGDETDELISLIKGVGWKEEPEFLSLGEIKSARLFYFGIKSRGIDGVVIEPSSPYWPLFIKDMEIIEDIAFKKVSSILNDLKDKSVFIFPGFIAIDESGKIITLGRGGSDTSAFMLGKLFNADEVIIVTDVEGVYNLDPNLFPAEKIKEISADKLMTLSSFGAKVMHEEALRFKDKNQKSKIIHYKFGDLEYEGTGIFGEVKRDIFLFKDDVSLITIHKEGIISDLWDLLKILNGTRIFSIITGVDFLGIYIPSNELKETIEKMLVIKSVDITYKNGISIVVLRKEVPVDRPGLVSSILEELKKANISIVEISSIGREIQIFVKKEDTENVLSILRKENL